MSYPAVACFRLDQDELGLVESWLVRYAPPQWRDEFRPGEMNAELNFFPDIALDELGEMLEWRLPVLVVAGAKLTTEEFHEFFRLGAAAVWVVPERDRPVVFPELKLPEVSGRIFAVIDDAVYRSVYRQIFRFAGYDLRLDFSSAEEIIELLRFIHLERSERGAPTGKKRGGRPGDERGVRSANEGGAPPKKERDERPANEDDERPANEGEKTPELVLLDLDSARMDMRVFFHRLRELIREHPRLRGALRIMATKDFARPGPDMSALAGSLRSFVRRIFHPRESLLALMEAYLFGAGRTDAAHYRSAEYRDVNRLLHGDVAPLPAKSPGETLEFFEREFGHIRRAMPFLRLYEHLAALTDEGAILRAQPEIDAGDALDRVGGPDAPGEPIENAPE